jgi:hypothetical protein
MKTNNTIKMAAAAAICLLAVTSVSADETKPKRSLKNNMNVVYNQLPPSADNITDAFANGMFYGRLRTNAFKWDWKDDANNDDNKAFGLGGSMVYKTAPLAGVSATAGLYYSNSPFSGLRVDNADVSDVKSGKDTFSRYNVSQNGDWQMVVLAEAYVQYNLSKTDFKLGRQMFESALTASNDTKMIPNTFEGISVESKDLPKTTLKAAYFTAQKLRDHTTFHDVLTFNDGTSNWNNNDDSGVHKGISYAKLTAAGKDVDNSLIVAAVSNQSIENLKVDLTYTAVPDMISSLIGELNYKIPVGNFAITPGVRYMKQMDDGAGAIGGASLSGNITAANAAANGYTEGGSLDSSLWMARLAVVSGAFKGQLGYSKVEDEGDIVAPWRNFPTGGYTRAMAQLNWKADAETVMAEAHYDFGKAKILEGFSAMARYAIQDSDEAKQGLGGGQADLTTIHVDLKQQINPQLDAKFRLGVVTADARTNGLDQDSYNEYRFELNYLF